MASSIRRDELYKKAFIVYSVFYCIFSAAISIFYIAVHDWYHAGISLGTFAIPIALAVMYRLLHWKRVWALDLLILIFTTISYQLGACIDLYHLLPGFDKLAHFLSGTFAGILCTLLYCLLTPEHKVSKESLPLALLFVFFGSMAVAGLWEIGEYILSKITLRDMQNVASTGVADSMQDMIVCLLGTLLLLPAVKHLAEGKTTVLNVLIPPFVEGILPRKNQR
ncbi:MAG: hypothetical protein E7335_11965 [Clostridiales bacterium]|nr:hypothetical protein [Clostridiales bacterium]